MPKIESPADLRKIKESAAEHMVVRGEGPVKPSDAAHAATEHISSGQAVRDPLTGKVE